MTRGTVAVLTASAACAALLLLGGCRNPFAPALDDAVGTGATPIGDPRTIDGFFQRFAASYAMRDTTLYGGLIADEFVFVFRDYDNNVDQTWGRDVEMRTTSGLFQTAQNLSLVWNDVVAQSGDSLSTDVTRSFNLTITFNPQDVVYITGRADLQLRRPRLDTVWMLTRWRDNSSF